MNAYLSTIKQLDPRLRYFYAAAALHSFTFFGIYSLLLNLFLLRLGYGPELIGIVNGTGPLVLAVGSIPAGQLSRRIGSRKAIMIGYALVGLGFMLLPVAYFLPATIQPSWITICYAFAWLAGALVIVNFNPFLMGSTTESQRNHAFAIHVAIFPLFGFLGNLLGGFLPSAIASLMAVTLDSPAPYAFVLFVGGTLYLIAAGAIWFTNDVKSKVASVNSDGKASKPPFKMLLMVLIFAVFIVAGDWSMRVYVNVYFDTVLEVPTALIGSISGVAQLIGMIALAAPWLMGRWGRKRVLLFGYIVAAMTFLPLIFIAHWAAVGASLFGLMIMSSLMNPVFGIFTQTRVKPEWRTTMASITAVATGLGVAMTALGGSRIITAYGFQAFFVGGALSILVGVGFFWRFFYQNRDGQDAAVDAVPHAKPALASASGDGGGQ